MPYAKGQKSRGSFRASPLSEHVAKGARTEAAGGQDEWRSGAVWLAHAARYVAPIAELCAYVVREGEALRPRATKKNSKFWVIRNRRNRRPDADFWLRSVLSTLPH